jgi:ribosomal protein L7/L12
MTESTKLFAHELESGATFEVALSRLRESGASPVQAIKAIREVRGVSLKEAKELFSQSPAWRLEAEAGARLQDAVLALLREEKSS